jgi:hypothetical protein
MMETASASEKSVNYQTTRHNNPEDSHFHTRYRENLKSQIHLPIFQSGDEGQDFRQGI